ncbi:hypothetical protein [Streptomyces sp. JJ36]|uniref:hypothetical protein n=1 Tax=Streptomyces sp. JJ36 TaxID=2736645 RepID=UPI001F486737|nr:hypothetical protein [Streptomyces sp. JJ36]MCF6524240.1 hypothetical protein [Streptomyces sp. JJ36]
MMLFLFPAVFLAGVAAVLGFLGYGIQTLVRHGVRRSGAVPVLRAGAAFAGAVATAVYLWGTLYVAGAVLEAEDGGAGSAPLPPCRIAGREEEVGHVIDYTVDFVPLRFFCETSDGGGYATHDVPGYVNPAAASLALTAASLAIAAGFASERRARTDAGRRRMR